MNTNSESVTCQTVVDPATNAVCGLEGDTRTMSYFRLPDHTTIVTCPSCTMQLAAGAKTEKLAFRYATVAAVRALSTFSVNYVSAMTAKDGRCSFKACGGELGKSDLVVHNGREFRRICGCCAAALDLVATRATEQLALHNAKSRLLSKRDYATATEQARLMPVGSKEALEAIRKNQETANSRTRAASSLLKAQLATKPTAAKPEAKAPVAPAAPVPQRINTLVPADFAMGDVDLTLDYELDPETFDRARLLCYQSKPRRKFLAILAELPGGKEAIERRKAAQEALATVSQPDHESSTTHDSASGAPTASHATAN